MSELFQPHKGGSGLESTQSSEMGIKDSQDVTSEMCQSPPVSQAAAIIIYSQHLQDDYL